MNSTEVLEINVIKQRKEQYIREIRKEIEIFWNKQIKNQIEMKKVQGVNKQTNKPLCKASLSDQAKQKKEKYQDRRQDSWNSIFKYL